jgi:bacteriocin biosynthesis cyclodehydratase domain-containing protein
MMTHPRISPHYSIIGHSPDSVELRYGIWNPVSLTLTDETKSGHLFAILISLDGQLSVADIARKVGLNRDDVEAVLDHLRELGALEETGPKTALDYYLTTVSPGLKSLDQPASNRFSSVLIIADGPVSQQIQANFMGSLPQGVDVKILSETEEAYKILFDPKTSWLMDGFAFEERMKYFEPWRGSLIVAAMEVINPIAFRTLNRVALHIAIPWLHAALDGPFVFVGPLFVPRRTSCYECFETRVAMNLREQSSYERYKNALVAGKIKGARLPLHVALCDLIAAHVAMEVINFVHTGSSFTISKTMGIYLPTMEIGFNDVLRLPGCTACGSHPERDDKELFFGFEMLAQTQPIAKALKITQ